MRLSQLLGRTLRKVTEEGGTAGSALLMRAAFMRRDPHAWLPLGTKLLEKCEALWEKEVVRGKAHRVYIPPVEKGDFTYREEALFALVRGEVSSYRQLPLFIQTRMEPGRPSLFHLEDTIPSLELYGFLPDEEGLEKWLGETREMIGHFLDLCGLEVDTPEGEGDWVVPAPGGDADIIACPSCGYTAARRWASFKKEPLPSQEPLPIQEVSTPGCTTIEAVANYVGVPTSHTLKAVFYADEAGEVVFVVIRGDLEVSEAKLSRALNWSRLRPATAGELYMAGIVAGYASPIGVKGVKVVGDDSITMGGNFVAGANKEGYHLLNVNYPRDFKVDVLTDIALARSGDPCPRCGSLMEEGDGILVASLRRPGPELSERLGLTYHTAEKSRASMATGVFALYPERLAEAIAEANHDDRGLVWPPPVAPFQIHLIGIGQEGREAAERLYSELATRGYEVLYDDRDESPGVQFNDADLIGLPLRIVVSKRTLARGSVEIKGRRDEKAELVPLEELQKALESRL